MTQQNHEPPGIEAQLWSAADTLRGNVDASEYKHMVLGLFFPKYISDAFEELHTKLEAEAGADPEDRDEYLAENVFWVPVEARWSRLQAEARQPTTGTMVSQEQLEMRIEDSVIKGDVIAKGDSSITLVNSVVQSQGANEDGSSFFGNLFVQDNATITLVDTVVEGAITKTGNGTVVVQ